MSPEGNPKERATILNASGDVVIRTTGSHGSDIASQRMDELDRAALHFALEAGARFSPAVAVDLGAGLGAQTARFASLGLSVLMIDLAARAELVDSINALYGRRVSAISGDVCRIPDEALPQAVHLLFSQRMVHYLRYGEAVRVLKRFASRMSGGARLFMSCACLASELSEGYSALGQPVEERFGYLAPAMAEKHNVLEPLCLYSKEEFASLAAKCGFSPLEIFQSEFGTLKGVFRRE